MVTKPVPDEELQRTIDAVREHGSNAKAAAALGVNESTVRRRLRDAELRDRRDPAVSAGMAAIGTGITPSGMWVKTGVSRIVR